VAILVRVYGKVLSRTTPAHKDVGINSGFQPEKSQGGEKFGGGLEVSEARRMN